MGEVTKLMRDMHKTMSVVSKDYKENDERLTSLEDKFNMKIVDFCREYKSELDRISLIANKLYSAKAPIPTGK